MNSDFTSRYKNLTLSATYDADSFFYCLWGDNKTLLQCGGHSEFLLATSKYADARVVISSNGLPYSHVPNSEYQKDHNELYLSNVSRLQSNVDWTFSSNEIGSYGIVTVYGFQQKLLQKYQIENQSDKIIHRSSALVWACLQYPVKQPAVFLNVADNHCSITVADNESLLFYNQFAFTAAEDILYYCCLIFDQLKLDRSKHHLMLSGNIAQRSTLYDLLFKYIHNVEFVDLDFNLEGGVDKPKHYFMDHYSLMTCV